jgi:hypothetical protein
MRSYCLLLLCILSCVIPSVAWGADLTASISTTDQTCAHLRQLDRWGLVPAVQRKLLYGKGQRPLTRYDVAFLLIEPLERCIAIVDVQDAPKAAPEQQRRADMAMVTFAKLTPAEFDTLVENLRLLVQSYAADIDQLMPGQSHRAAVALMKLTQPQYRPWMKAQPESADAGPTFHWHISPNVPLDSFSIPFALLTPVKGETKSAPLSMRTLGDKTDANQPVTSSQSVSSLEAAVDLALGRFRLYGSLATLPGQDPATVILNPDGSGKAMLGLEVGLMRLRDVGISGILEFHIMRSGDPANLDTNTGAVGGIGLSW